ncbi:MAG: hypothetical protein EKK57_04425 [Proteobacteria bacterium]|nr:MAG: hypothetical protein EKK57_04425 [Pseudomonadota bacterium]
MKKVSVMMLFMAIGLFGCDKKVSIQDVQEGTQHINNIVNSQNASEVISNVAHATNDISEKMKESSAQ